VRHIIGPAPAVNGAVVIEHITTSDLPDGQVCPPFYDGAIWCVVNRGNGRTLWRRILSATSSGTAWRTEPEDHSPAPAATSK
jgi:hypothetical protein